MTGVVSFVGAGTINATPNTGRLTIALKPISQRDPAPVVIARLQRAIAGIPGITAFFQPVQDIQIGTRISRTQFQYTLMDTDPAELALWAPRLLHRLAADPALRNVATDQQNDGFRTYINVDRDAAMRLGVSMQAIEDTLYDAFGQRQISTIFGQSNQYRVVLEADPSWQADPNYAAAAARAGHRTARRCRCPAIATIDAHRGAAGGHAPGAVPRRSRSASIWRPAIRWATRSQAIAAAEQDDRHAGDDHPAAIPATPRSSRRRWPPSRG